MKVDPPSAPLRPVCGFPALRLLRGLRPHAARLRSPRL